MQNKKKLNLSTLKVDSFVTSMDSEKTNTVKGGTSVPCGVAATVVVIFTEGVTIGVTISYTVFGNQPNPNDSVCCSNLGACKQTNAPD